MAKERHDAIGLFWSEPRMAVKPKKVKPKPFWLAPTFLPGLDKATRMEGLTRMTPKSWREALAAGDWLSMDTECYPNYFAVGFRNRRTGEVDWMELDPENGLSLDISKLTWILNRFPIIGFNSDKYDLTMLALALNGADNATLKKASDDMIVGKVAPSLILKGARCPRLRVEDQIDLQEIVPGFHSLKIYGGRMHTQRMQDLPFPPETRLSFEQKAIVRYYMCNDLRLTEELANKLKGEIDLRIAMSNQYGINLLSKSDAQIAEQVIKTMFERQAGYSPTPPQIDPGTAYAYNVPSYLSYRSETMRSVLEVVRSSRFVVGESGHIDLPESLSGMDIRLGNSVYRLGIGGIHSTEKEVSHYADDVYTLVDADVASFYPRIILNQKLYPEHLGPDFLIVYDEIVRSRLEAKTTGNKVVADSLKIVINSSFGKFGSKYSILYSPQFVIQVTLSGQLSLLMLIDALESVGIQVISANTDGIVIKARHDQAELRDKILAWWQKTCQFEMEYTSYESIHSANVNSYFAIKKGKDGKKEAKRKGLYAKEGLSTTPGANVCANAVEKFLTEGIPIEETIRSCTNVYDFVTVRNVSGGAVWGTDRQIDDPFRLYLGKVVRYYYGRNYDDCLLYAQSGKRVPSSDAAIPLMDTDGSMPDDINYDEYVYRANEILKDIGVIKRITGDSLRWTEEGLSPAPMTKDDHIVSDSFWS
jgi:hypothetical protein